MKKLQGKVAVVTASSRGIGFATADLLAENGAKVYIGVFSQDEAQNAITSIRQKGNHAEYVYFDGKQKGCGTKMIEDVLEKEGKVDILINNFGIADVTVDLDVVHGDADAFTEIVTQNLESVYLPSKAAIPSMIENGGGTIVNISSIGSVMADLSRVAYCVSKAAINSLTQNIAFQYARYNIRCNAVLPSMVETLAVKNNMSPEFIDSFLSHVPLNRVAQPEDIAKTVLYFASDDSSYVTGQLQEVSGGYGLGSPQYAEFNKLR